MSAKLGGFLAGIAALFLIVGFSSDQDRNKQNPASVRLIESIQGPALYNAYCAVCHGVNGKGDGPLAKSLKTAPPDLTRIAARNHGKFPLAHLQQIISGETPVLNGHGTREMPVWGPIFSQIAWDQDLGRIRVYNLAKHIEEIQAKQAK